jgi:hypothetical protein
LNLTTIIGSNRDTKNKKEVSKMDYKGQSAIAGVAIATLVFLIVLTVYGQVQSSLNTSVFSAGVVNLINLIPLVLVGAAIIGIIVVAFRLSA